MSTNTQPRSEESLLPLQKIVRYHHMSVRRFGKLFGVSHNTAARIIDGEFPKLPVAIRIARVFHCSVEDIWGRQVKDIDIRP